MWIFWWIVFGVIVGWMASIITKNNGRMGLLKNILTGLVGAVIGGWISTLLGIGSYATFSFGSFIIALVGAVLLLMVINYFTRHRK